MVLFEVCSPADCRPPAESCVYVLSRLPPPILRALPASYSATLLIPPLAGCQKMARPPRSLAKNSSTRRIMESELFPAPAKRDPQGKKRKLHHFRCEFRAFK